MKTAVIAILVGIFVGGCIAFGMRSDVGMQSTASANNVHMAAGTQIIEVTAKGGYTPRVTLAKAQTPTLLKVNTRGTFDCSASLTIPKLNYFANLPPSDVTEIEVPPQKSGTTLQGLCAMGMYGFQIKFN